MNDNGTTYKYHCDACSEDFNPPHDADKCPSCGSVVIEYIFEHGCGRFLRIDAYCLDYEDSNEDSLVYLYEYSGTLFFEPHVSMAHIEYWLKETIGWSARVVISWANNRN